MLGLPRTRSEAAEEELGPDDRLERRMCPGTNRSWASLGPQNAVLYKLLDVTEIPVARGVLQVMEEKTALMIEELTLIERGSCQTRGLFQGFA
jgi:hypothetical protein